ncbi:MAG: hypothetical protein BMS9Abin05_1292 [Rhodothermia bacterium]|nr:MAG: hypothetical protein BMS9Abin05_1292 [Rhodothermia bacterium]
MRDTSSPLSIFGSIWTRRPSASRKRPIRSDRPESTLPGRIRKASTKPTRRPVSYTVTFEPSSLPRKLFFVAIGLLAAHAILSVIHYEFYRLPWLFRQLFDLDEENNLPTWYSSIALFITSIFLWLCAREKQATDDPWKRQWKILALGFFVLSIDEVAGMHETFNSLIKISWAIPGGLLAVVIGFLFIPFLLGLERQTAKLFVLSGVIYIGGAIGVELLAAPLRVDSLQYYLMTLWEEGMEMIGVLLFLYALLRYMSGQHRNPLRVMATVTD